MAHFRKVKSDLEPWPMQLDIKKAVNHGLKPLFIESREQVKDRNITKKTGDRHTERTCDTIVWRRVMAIIYASVVWVLNVPLAVFSHERAMRSQRDKPHRQVAH